MKIEIRLLDKKDTLTTFDCGVVELNQFLQKYAKQNQFRHYIGVTYVAVAEERIVGYFSVSAGSIRIENVSNSMASSLPRYPLPILRLTRLAIDMKFQNMGIGSQILKFVLQLTLSQKEQFGCFGLLVDAKEESMDFYRQYGFESIEVKAGALDIRPYAKSMFLATKVIAKSLR